MVGLPVGLTQPHVGQSDSGDGVQASVDYPDRLTRLQLDGEALGHAGPEDPQAGLQFAVDVDVTGRAAPVRLVSGGFFGHGVREQREAKQQTASGDGTSHGSLRRT